MNLHVMFGVLAGLWIGLCGVVRPLSAQTTPKDEPVPAAEEAEKTPSADEEAQDAVDERQAVYDDVALLTEALLMVKRHYVEEQPYQKIIYGAIHGMLASLDPHSDFLEPRQFEDIREETEGAFGGIGIQIGLHSGYPSVIAPIEDTPAFAAGLMGGDRIVAVDGESTLNFSMESAMKSLRGDPGSSVTLTIARDGREPFDVRIVRDRIRVASVKGIRVLRGNIGYLRITQFSEPTAEAFAQALETLQTNQLEGLVIDLRDNPGGLLAQAIAIAEQLLPDKAVIVKVRGREGVRPEEVFRSDGNGRVPDLPLAVLINRGSASASEIVAGALQDHGRAVLVGEKSFGKASVQNILKLSTRADCGIKLTTAHYYTPGDRLIHEQGIEPDIVAALSPEEWRKAQWKRLYEEQPNSFPKEQRLDVAEVVDVPLERALDALIGARIFRKASQR